MSKICVFSAICEDDKQWIDQYLAEMERLELPFVIYLDRCSEETKNKFKSHRLLVNLFEQNNPDVEFREDAKQRVFDLIPKGYEWAMAWDVDETWYNFKTDLPNVDYIDTIWVNLWEDDKHLRIGLGFGPRPRTKFYNLSNKWTFNSPVINGPYCQGIPEPVKADVDIVCIHHGLMTKELRLQHKERWDRIYTKAVGSNPYQLWEMALDETIVPEIISNPYV